MKRLVIAVLFVVAYALAGPAHAQVKPTTDPTQGCLIAPGKTGADYLAKFDAVRGQAKDGKLGYPEPRVLIEWQSWLTPVIIDPATGKNIGPAPGHESEHIHWIACVPQGVKWLSPNDARYLDIMVIFNRVQDYDVASIAGSFVTKTGSRGAFDTASPEYVNFLARLNIAADSSAFGPYSEFGSLKVRPSTTNARKEFRGNLKLVEAGPFALVPDWRLDNRMYVTDDYAGLPAAEPLVDNVCYLRMRTMIVAPHPTTGEIVTSYHHAGYKGSCNWTRSFFGANRSEPTWAVPLRVTDGGGPLVLEVDSTHHGHDDPGIWHSEGYMFSSSGKSPLCPDGVYADCPDPMPTGTLPSGLHTLFFGSDDDAECIRENRVCPSNARDSWRNVVKIPFRLA